MSDLPTSVHRTRAEQSSTWERQFTPKQIYAGMGLAHLAIILTGVYRLLTVRGAEWRLIIIVVIVLDICLLAFLTPRVLKIIKQSERGRMAVYDRHAYKNSEAVSAYLCFGNFVGVVKTFCLREV